MSLKQCAYCGCEMIVLHTRPWVNHAYKDVYSLDGLHRVGCPMTDSAQVDYPTKQAAIDACNMRSE